MAYVLRSTYDRLCVLLTCLLLQVACALQRFCICLLCCLCLLSSASTCLRISLQVCLLHPAAHARSFSLCNWGFMCLVWALVALDRFQKVFVGPVNLQDHKMAQWHDESAIQV